jgi:hypothetical protein
MPVMTEQRGRNMQQTRRDLLVGNWFIVRDEQGEPRTAGRINSITESGEYVVRVWFNADGTPSHGETVPPAELRGWLLFTNESSWRKAFTTMTQ